MNRFAQLLDRLHSDARLEAADRHDELSRGDVAEHLQLPVIALHLFVR